MNTYIPLTSTRKIISSASAMDYAISNIHSMMVPFVMGTNCATYYFTIKPSALNKSKTNVTLATIEKGLHYFQLFTLMLEFGNIHLTFLYIKKNNSEMGTLLYTLFCHAKDVYSEIYSE